MTPVPPTDEEPGGNQQLAIYSDSVFYVSDAKQNLIKPVTNKSGTFAAFPDGLKIDETTGEIDISKSETGLKYEVTFQPSDAPGKTEKAYLTISGINYEDKIYNLSKGDSLATPIYNANSHQTLPGGAVNLFDEGEKCKKAGIIINSKNGLINLAQTVREQRIDTGATEQVKLAYRINDPSNKALNGLEMKVYFYRTVAEIPSYLTELLSERKGTILTANNNTAQNSRIAIQSVQVAKSTRPARPRPPCIIVVSR
ncbi:MAG: hypothetical protein JKY70_18955 [Mucilaginibacter sp.]|nr:hypothetical protein [Mucilaginibacter sp.]